MRLWGQAIREATPLQRERKDPPTDMARHVPTIRLGIDNLYTKIHASVGAKKRENPPLFCRCWRQCYLGQDI